MSNYRNIVAIALVAMMGLSIFSLISGAFDKEEEVNSYLQQAQIYAEQGLFAKAEGMYAEAIDVQNDLGIYNTIADMYYENGHYENSIAWAEETISQFPTSTDGYERTIRGYMALESYKKVFRTMKEYDGRRLHSEQVEQYREELKAMCYFSSFPVDDVTQTSSGFYGVKKNDAWGIVSASGSTLINSEYSMVGYMGNGAVAVRNQEGIWFLADTNGELMANVSEHIESQIDEIGLLNADLFPVKSGNTWNYYNTEFVKQFETYEYAGSFVNGIAAVRKGNAWYLINTSGEIISDAYDEIITDHRGVCWQEGVVIAKTGGKCVILNENGKVRATTAFEDAKLPVNGELFAVKQNGKWGFADAEGKIVIEAQYEDARSFSNGFAAVCVDGMWGYIDENNVLCIAAEFYDCRDMSASGTAFIKEETRWKLLKLYCQNYEM